MERNGPTIESDALMLAGGEAPEPVPDRFEATWVVAVDAGLDLAERLGVRPDLVVGDFDSVSAGALERARVSGIPIEEHPIDKDETDWELGLQAVVDRGCKSLVILGGGGGSLGHTLANAHVLASSRFERIAIEWWLGLQRVHVARAGRSVRIRGQLGDSVSLIPVGGAAREVSTDGLRWVLDGEDLEPYASRGVGNELTARHAAVAVRRGALLVVHEGRSPEPRRPQSTSSDV